MIPPSNHNLILSDLDIAGLTDVLIARHSSGGAYPDARLWQYVVPLSITVNEGTFTNQYSNLAFPEVGVSYERGQLSLTCGCNGDPGKLCDHQALVLSAIIKRDDLLVFFNEKLRQKKLRKFAAEYGLENDPDPDRHFVIEYQHKQLVIRPRLDNLLPVTAESLGAFTKLVNTGKQALPEKSSEQPVVVVLRKHKYYNYLYVELYSAALSKDFKIKNPLSPVQPLELIWDTEDQHQLKFFAGVNKFQNHLNAERSQGDLTALRAIIRNPLQYDFYYHDPARSANINAGSLVPVKVSRPAGKLALQVTRNGPFYELGGTWEAGNKTHELQDLETRFNYFILLGDTLYLVEQLQLLGMIDLLKARHGNLLIHESKFDEFRKKVLGKLEDSIKVNYTFIKPATALQLKEHNMVAAPERILYLSDFGQYVMIVPVMRYGEVEVPIRTKKQIFSIDHRGREFAVDRNQQAEDDFTSLLLRQHPFFGEQLDTDLYYYYLHKKRFLEEDWLLNAFEEWERKNITVLGFNELEGNELNPRKVKITINVLSGINWFNAEIRVSFGRRKASLKQVQRALRNKSKYVRLDDGTLGILPAEWIEKFAAWFNAGEVSGQSSLHIPRVNFTAVDELFDHSDLDTAVIRELQNYRERFAGFEEIRQVAVPAELQADLRHYQQAGLNWLNFLDELGFGGCLADDMGLGKTIQVLAFLLMQKEKKAHGVNLVVAPTSLIFNWQEEVQKFAPSLKVLSIGGPGRHRNITAFGRYDIILISYGTLLSDIGHLKDFTFNYVILDEAQNIRNPASQRHKAARLLQSRSRIALTGTPLENSTFDLYGLFSFVCPGLLGNRQYFRDIYSQPIDKFHNSVRARELQDKISPFLLRRTKQQVAEELPEKTEMLLYCELDAVQRKIYDAYEKEFRDYISATTNEELLKSPMNVLKGLTRLRQICDSPALMKGEKLLSNESAKMELLIAQVLEKSPEHKILIFSQFVGMLELIKKELLDHGIACAWLTGGTRNRKQEVDRFQTDPSLRVFLVSLKAGGTGLNLTAADYVYLVEPWWNPAVENQAIDRAHRIGQDKKVVAVKLICKDTVEEKMMQLQQSKKDLARDLIRAEEGFIKSLSRQDLLKLLD